MVLGRQLDALDTKVGILFISKPMGMFGPRHMAEFETLYSATPF